jgi:hypothetical protein
MEFVQICILILRDDDTVFYWWVDDQYGGNERIVFFNFRDKGFGTMPHTHSNIRKDWNKACTKLIA